MEEGLLLYGIDMPCDEFAIDETPKRAIPVLADSALSPFARMDAAPLLAQGTEHLPFFQTAVEQSLLHGGLLRPGFAQLPPFECDGEPPNESLGEVSPSYVL